MGAVSEGGRPALAAFGNDADRAGAAASAAVSVFGAASGAATLADKLCKVAASNSRFVAAGQSLDQRLRRRLDRLQEVEDQRSGVKELIDIEQDCGRTGFGELTTAFLHRSATVFLESRKQQFVFNGCLANDHAADIRLRVVQFGAVRHRVFRHRVVRHGRDGRDVSYFEAATGATDNPVAAGDCVARECERPLRSAADDVSPGPDSHEVLEHADYADADERKMTRKPLNSRVNRLGARRRLVTTRFGRDHLLRSLLHRPRLQSPMEFRSLQAPESCPPPIRK